jgi:uncharacterized protein (DUF362 family)
MKMKRTFLLSAVILLLGASVAFAGPTVAIVKSDNHEVSGEQWNFSMFDFTKRWETTWTPESEAYIESMVRRAVDLAGGLPVKPGDDVCIKVNLVQDGWYVLSIELTKNDIDPNKYPVPDAKYFNQLMQSILTDARVAKAVCKIAQEKGAGRVSILEGPNAGLTAAYYLVYGYKDWAEKMGVKLLDPDVNCTLRTYRPKTRNPALSEYVLPAEWVNADCRISIGKMKTHDNAGISLTLKNVAVGIAPKTVYGAIKLGLPHNKMHRVVADVNSICAANFAIVDGLWGMEGWGAFHGTPVASDLIIAGRDPVAVDSVGAMCMGTQPWIYGNIRECHENGIGTYDDINIVGTKLMDAVKLYAPVPAGKHPPSTWSGVVAWE